MKKFLTLMLIVLLVSVAFVGCASPAEEEEPAEDPVQEEPAEEEEPAAEGEEGSIASFGLGHVISTAKSTGAEGDDTAQAQADVTIAAVGFDGEGRVVDVTIDVAQTRIAFDEDMAVADRDADVRTKKEKEDDYNMRGASEIDAEWFEQAEALEEWMVGKTVEEIMSMEVTERDESHTHVPAEEDLTSSVTITVEGYLAAVEEAWENAEDVEGAETVALGINTSIDSSRDADDENTARAQADTYIAATAFDADENVAGVIIDTAQVRVDFDEDGQLASDIDEEGKSKKELEDDYNMRGVSEIDAEWFEQIEALEEWMVGKSVDEIMNMEVTERDESHTHVPAEEDLTSSVTITVEGYLGVVEKSLENAQ